MCGIVGTAVPSGKAPHIAGERARQLLDSIRHRGPDSEGQSGDAQIWLGHVRLSILDLSEAGCQPMTSADQRFVICYNGEVYNFRELSGMLQLTGLRSHSDTEVVLRAFMKLGIESFRLLNGMFAFALYDRQEKKLWLVRDRFGIKPLYFHLDGEGLLFASEIKALIAAQPRLKRCDISALHEWLYYGTSLGEHTLYQGIRKLLPGHYLELDLTGFASRIESYWTPTPRHRVRGHSSPEGRVGATRELLEAAVKRQLVSDVPVGVFLSGGIDSTAITAFASRHYSGKLATYTAGFDFAKGVNELPKARSIARLYGTSHHELHISGFEIADVVQKMVEHHDMPFSDAANIPLYLLSCRIKDTTKVVLQGDGGDEVFGGYRRYTTLSFLKTARGLAKLANLINGLSPRNSAYHRRQRYINALSPADPAQVMALLLTEEDVRSAPAAVFAPAIRREIEQTDPFARYRQCQRYFGAEDPVNQMLLVDLMIILPDIFLEKVDRSTMAASVEVRVPFLDNDLVDFCLQLSGAEKVRFGRKKWLLKEALKGVVPNGVLYGSKTGFGVPYGYWLRTALQPLFMDQLERFERMHPSVLDRATIMAMYDQHCSRRRDRSFLLWKVLNLMIWANTVPISFAH